VRNDGFAGAKIEEAAIFVLDLVLGLRGRFGGNGVDLASGESLLRPAALNSSGVMSRSIGFCASTVGEATKAASRASDSSGRSIDMIGTCLGISPGAGRG
jgi:hypothetical protein